MKQPDLLPGLDGLHGAHIWQTEQDIDMTRLPSPRAVKLHYERARDICQRSGMTVRDVLDMTPKFWAYHSHYVTVRDTSAWTIATINWNLCIGTIARFADGRPDLHRILADLQAFRVCGEFMLTEVSHGLDARNIETTATLQADGSFDLHTPRFGASKAMPPTTLCCGLPRIGVVFARLIVHGDDRGIRPFVVPLSQSTAMCDGVSSRILPQRPGARHLDHAITSFEHVRISADSMLGVLERPKDLRQDFLRQIERVAVGTLALSQIYIPALRLVSHIVCEYSKRRTVSSPTTLRNVPIISFRTQVRPIVLGLCVAAVLEEFSTWSVNEFVTLKNDPKIQHGIATVFKTTTTDLATPVLDELVQRCGWQGLMRHNQMIELLLALRGNSIAEGDVLVLCIRLGSELIQGRYDLPAPQAPYCSLAEHEIGLMQEARSKFRRLSQEHRSEGFNAHILPLCRGVVRAVGFRMAYEAARRANVSPLMLDVFEALCIEQDLSWFIENSSRTQERFRTRGAFFDTYAHVITRAVPFLDEWLANNGAAPWITAPIIDDKAAEGFLTSLPRSGPTGNFDKSCRATTSFQPRRGRPNL